MTTYMHMDPLSSPRSLKSTTSTVLSMSRTSLPTTTLLPPFIVSVPSLMISRTCRVLFDNLLTRTYTVLQSKALGEDLVREQYPEATIVRPAAIFGHEDRLTILASRQWHLLLLISLLLSPFNVPFPLFY